MLTLIVLSFSVAADATAVAIAASVRGVTLARGLLMAGCFGLAQSLMAGVGWMGGAVVGNFWKAWDHWVALTLLSIVGVKMIREAFDEDQKREPVVGRLSALLVLTIATSIDALAVGVSLPTLGMPAILALAMMGLVTFALSLGGAAFGRFLGEKFGRVIEVAGGVCLIAIGVRVAVEHTR